MRHVSDAFRRPPRTPLVVRRHAVALTHARLAWAALHYPVDDHAVKDVDLCGSRISFFDWRTLHYLYDEIFIDEAYSFAPRNDAPRIIDAGANIGMATLWFSLAFPKACITAIEPDPATFDLLRRNVERNHLYGVNPVEGALASHSGVTELLVDPCKPGSLWMSTEEGRMTGVPLQVSSHRLSSLIDGPVDLLKLDVEGAEHDVIEELDESGALQEVQSIIMEYHHHLNGHDDRLGELLGTLATSGFTYYLSAARLRGPLDSDAVRGYQDIAVLAARRDPA
jgi:FkbM family methyltransferase